MREYGRYWIKLADAFIIKPRSFEDLVFKKYLELESVVAVARYLKENNYRKDNGTVYNSNDVSAILRIFRNDVIEPIIIEAVRNKFKKAKRYQRW